MYNTVVYARQVPAVADAHVRTQLIERAAAHLAAGETVTLRQLAAEVGTSTMAVYTRFGGMAGLWGAVRTEGFARLDTHLRRVPRTRDPVRDVVAVGAAYVANALANPHLYGLMFQTRGEDPPDNADETFGVLVAAVARARDAGRFASGTDPAAAAVQVWAMTHGVVMLVLAGALTVDDLSTHLPAMSVSAFVGFGDERAKAERSAARGWTLPAS